jgi:hypothetical protein
VNRTAETTERLGRAVFRRTRAFIDSGGAKETGLSRLIVVHAVNYAGDALVTVALAGTLFFGVPTGTARGRVVLYLLITIAPFAVVAPFIGPVLDRLRQGRRIAMAVTALGRAALCLALGRAIVTHDNLALYPAALGVLVLSKAYAVARSSAVPRLLPEGRTLVQVNGRMTLAALVPATLIAPVGAAINYVLDPSWTLRAASLIYLVAVVCTIRLPRQVDGAPTPTGAPPPARVRRRRMPASVLVALRSAALIRALSGFLLLFVAFLARRHHLSTLPPNLVLGLLAGALAVGGLLGTTVGVRLRGSAPDRLVTLMLAVATTACLVTTDMFGVATVLALAFVTAVSQSLSKLALDSVIQRDVPESVRTTTFGRSESTLQLAWVIGGVAGILLPPHGALGFGLAGGVLFAGMLVAVVRRRRSADSADPVPGPPVPGPAVVDG